jgi:O-antigen/teichoic acid export membrane protein
LSEKFAALVFGFGGAVLLFRSLTKEAFGVWVLFLSITSIVEVGRIGLLQNALVKYLATSDEQEAGRITTASIILNVMLTAGIVAFLLLLASPISLWMNVSELAVLLKIYCLTTVMLIPFFQFNYVQQANLDFRGIFWSNFVKGGVLFGFILYLFVSGGQIELKNLAICQIGAAVAAAFVSWFFANKYFRFSSTLDWLWVKKLFRFGKYVFGTNLSTQLYKNVDKLLIGGLPAGGTAAVALYDAAIRVTNLTDVPTASMANILFPQSAKRFQDGNGAVKQLYEKAVGAILAFMVPCILFVMLFAEWIIHLVAGPGYEEAANLLRITILFGLFMPYAVQFGTVLDSIGKPRMNFIFTIGSLALTATLNVFFITRWGAYGAAAGTLAAYASTFVAMQLYLAKLLKVNPLNPFVQMIHFYKKALDFGWKQWRNLRSPETAREVSNF